MREQANVQRSGNVIDGFWVKSNLVNSLICRQSRYKPHPTILGKLLRATESFRGMSRLPIDAVGRIFTDSSQCSHGSLCITERRNVVLSQEGIFFSSKFRQREQCYS